MPCSKVVAAISMLMFALEAEVKGKARPSASPNFVSRRPPG
jgi:hypothetical protein